MPTLLLKNKLKISIMGLIILLITIGIFPGTGGEGAQRDFSKLNQKRDWWNFVTAALYGTWPNKIAPWTYSLTVAQLLLYALGIYLISKEVQSQQNRKVLFILATIGALFVFQLWRDSTLFAIQTLSFGLLAGLKHPVNFRYISRILTALALSIFGSLFKPIFAPIIFILFILSLGLKIQNWKQKTSLLIIGSCLSFFPILFDRQLSNSYHLIKSYPEQQVIIYDLSKLYCWGYSSEVVLKAKKSLEPLLANPNDFESICASLSPSGWDSLHVKIPEVKSSPSLKTITEDQKLLLNSLIGGWARIVITHPIDWLMTKASDSTQVLFMANAFHMPGLYSNSNSIFLKLGDYAIQLLLIPIHVLDKIRFFSLSFTLLFGLFLIYQNRASKFVSIRKERILFRFLAVNLFLMLLATLAFIANNGRYVLPYILLSYFFIVLEFEKEKINFFSTKT